MIHPSYSDLMRVVNSGTEFGEEPVVNSRYSIVIATAKRARQIIAGDEPMIEHADGKKPLSVAVEELNEGKVKILAEDAEEETDEIQNEFFDLTDEMDRIYGNESDDVQKEETAEEEEVYESITDCYEEEEIEVETEE